MPRLVDQLTEAKIRTLVTQPGFYPDGRGLYLQVRPNSYSWIFRYTIDKRTRDKGLGALADVSLVAARARAAEQRGLVARKVDPIDAAEAVRTAARITIASSGPTFEESAETFMDDKLKRLRSEVHRHQWRQSLRDYAYPLIGRKPVADVDTNDVLAVLRPIWDTKCETAGRLRGRIERILARATVEGHRTGANPATWRGHLQEALPKRSEVQPVVRRSSQFVGRRNHRAAHCCRSGGLAQSSEPPRVFGPGRAPHARQAAEQHRAAAQGSRGRVAAAARAAG